MDELRIRSGLPKKPDRSKLQPRPLNYKGVKAGVKQIGYRFSAQNLPHFPLNSFIKLENYRILVKLML